MWYDNIYMRKIFANLLVFACFSLVTTIITMHAICKHFQYIRILRRELAFNIDKFAFVFHAALMILQVLASFMYIFAEIALMKTNFGPKAEKVAILCTNIQFVIDFFIQLCIQQICWQCGGLARQIKIKRIMLEEVLVSNSLLQQ